MGSTARKIIAELQHAGRATFSSALQKIKPVERHKVNKAADQMYRKLVKTDPKINKTDILQLLAAIGALSASLEPDYTGSS